MPHNNIALRNIILLWIEAHNDEAELITYLKSAIPNFDIKGII
jgi:hypothetical protein